MVAFVQCRIEGDLAREDSDVFDGVVGGALAGAQRIGSFCKLQLEHQVELRRQKLARLEHPDERGCHQDVLEALRRDGRRRAADLPEARDPLVPVPLGTFEQ